MNRDGYDKQAPIEHLPTKQRAHSNRNPPHNAPYNERRLLIVYSKVKLT